SALEVAGETGTVEELGKQVEEAGATDVLLLDGRFLGDLYPEPLAQLEAEGVDVLQIVSPRDSLLGLRKVGEIGGMPSVILSTHVLPPSQARLKRLIDVALLTLSAPVTVPLIASCALYTLLVAGRPILFTQP